MPSKLRCTQPITSTHVASHDDSTCSIGRYDNSNKATLERVRITSVLRTNLPACWLQLGAAQEEAAAMDVGSPSRSRSRSASRERKDERAREKWRDSASTRRVRCPASCACWLAAVP
jgi:hypothetical protein